MIVKIPLPSPLVILPLVPLALPGNVILEALPHVKWRRSLHSSLRPGGTQRGKNIESKIAMATAFPVEIPCLNVCNSLNL